MGSTRERRILKELQDINDDKDNSGVWAAPISEGNLLHLRGSFPGPPDTPYAGGLYKVDIQIPENYPFKSPQMKFETKMWHPNISSQTGAICLDTLSSAWSPVGTIKMALISLRMLLEKPNPNDPQDAEVARMMKDDRDYFDLMAHDYAVRYAGAPRRLPSPDPRNRRAAAPRSAPAEVDPQRLLGYSPRLVERFTSMGFELDAVVEAFQFVGIDRNGGEDYELEEAYMGDITARLLGEQ